MKGQIEFSSRRRSLLLAAAGSLVAGCGGGGSDDDGRLPATPTVVPIPDADRRYVQWNPSPTAAALGFRTGGLDLMVRATHTELGWSPVSAVAQYQGANYHIGFPESAVGPLNLVDEASGTVLKTSLYEDLYVLRRFGADGRLLDSHALFQDEAGSIFIGRPPASPIFSRNDLQDIQQLTQGPGTPVELITSGGTVSRSALDARSYAALRESSSAVALGETDKIEKIGVVLAALALVCFGAGGGLLCLIPVVPAAIIGLLLWIFMNHEWKKVEDDLERIDLTKKLFNRSTPVVDWSITGVGSGSCDDSVFDESRTGSAAIREDGSFEMLVEGRSLRMVYGGTTIHSESFPEDEGTTSQTVRISLGRDGQISGHGSVRWSGPESHSCSGSISVSGSAVLFAEVPGMGRYQLT